MSNLTGCYMHNTDDWKTPKKMYDYFMKEGYIDCFKYQSKENQLDYLYIDQKLFINPPYSKMNEILCWLRDQIYLNKVVLLVPARTDTKWFHKLIEMNPTIYFIKGRLHFNESKKSAPFPSILMVFDHYEKRTYEIL